MLLFEPQAQFTPKHLTFWENKIGKTVNNYLQFIYMYLFFLSQVWYLLGWLFYLQLDKQDLTNNSVNFRKSAWTYLSKAKKVELIHITHTALLEMMRPSDFIIA